MSEVIDGSASLYNLPNTLGAVSICPKLESELGVPKSYSNA